MGKLRSAGIGQADLEKIRISRSIMPRDIDPLSLLGDLISRARAAGADAADALLSQGSSLSLAQRLGKPERLERSEAGDLGLRVFVGKRQAIVSSTDLKAAALTELIERAVAMAKLAPEDPYCGLAEPEDLARSFADLDLFDPVEPAPERLQESARLAEEAALAVTGVTNSEGAEVSWGSWHTALVASNGFAGSVRRSSHGLSVSVLAGSGTGMERDYDYTSAVHGADLEDPSIIGRRAGERAVKRLGPRKVATTKVPIVYERRIAGAFLRYLANAISGSSIARGTSFLKDRMGTQVFASHITIIDDPLKKRGLRSRSFDGEGLPQQRRNIIDKGVLTSWFLDLRSARQLNLRSTGHASRGTSGPPSPSPANLYMQPGPLSPEALIADIDEGFYVTDTMGFGVNGVTGDYSQGASGFWIEKGRLAYPVSEVTIAGNLKQMFLNITPANNLEFKSGMDAPDLRVEGLTLAGA
jgi:PmbA protein